MTFAYAAEFPHQPHVRAEIVQGILDSAHGGGGGSLFLDRRNWEFVIVELAQSDEVVFIRGASRSIDTLCNCRGTDRERIGLIDYRKVRGRAERSSKRKHFQVRHRV